MRSQNLIRLDLRKTSLSPGSSRRGAEDSLSDGRVVDTTLTAETELMRSSGESGTAGILRRSSIALGVTVGVLSLISLVPALTYAQSVPVSPSYSTREYYFGTGGDTNLNSAQYSARTATGALGTGGTAGTAYQSATGTITPQDEYIEFVVNATTVNLGLQSTGTATTGTGTFYVKAYVASGYVVRNAATAPKITSHTLASPSSAVASAIGTEQFGINLVANTSPATFGAVPAQIPSSAYSFGAAASGYNTANVYKYVNGDVIAQSTKSSGQTNFTVSYILNISTTTPSGEYIMNHVMVATGTY